jgi:hypothetical protein
VLGLGKERPEPLQTSRNLRLDRALGPAEGLGGLGDAEPVDVPKDDCDSNGGRQSQERRSELIDGLAARGDGRWAGRPGICELEAGVQHRFQGERRSAIVGAHGFAGHAAALAFSRYGE